MMWADLHLQYRHAPIFFLGLLHVPPICFIRRVAVRMPLKEEIKNVRTQI